MYNAKGAVIAARGARGPNAAAIEQTWEVSAWENGFRKVPNILSV